MPCDDVVVFDCLAFRVNFGPHFIFPPPGYNPNSAAIAKANPFRGNIPSSLHCMSLNQPPNGPWVLLFIILKLLLHHH